MKTNDRRDGDMPRELPFNSSWRVDVRDDAPTNRGNATALAIVRACIDDARMPWRRAQP